jgi:hypothetical protein
LCPAKEKLIKKESQLKRKGIISAAAAGTGTAAIAQNKQKY